MKRKLVFITSLLVLSLCMLPTRLNLVVIEASNGYPVHNLNTGLSYTTIQEAINASETLDGHTIFVEKGIYYENVAICKKISLIGENKSETIINGNSTGNAILINASNVEVSNFTIESSGDEYEDAGIMINEFGYSMILNNILRNNNIGVYISNSANNTVCENVITRNSDGIRMSSRSGPIGGPFVTNNNTISNNVITDNSVLNILSLAASETRLINNEIGSQHVPSSFGVYFASAVGSILKNNTIYGCRRNLSFEGSVLKEFLVEADPSNTVNGKPVYYLVNQENVKISSDSFGKIGYLAVINSTGIVIENLTLANNGQGVLLAYSSHVQLCNLTLQSNSDGVAVIIRWGGLFTNITISKCLFTQNSRGIFVDGGPSIGGTVVDNDILGNDYGIELNDVWSVEDYAAWNVTQNTISNSRWSGISLRNLQDDNIFYHNNLVNNHQQVEILYMLINGTPVVGKNKWDYNNEGNYWCDYNGTDADENGVGDVPYIIDENYQDNYPLMSPWGTRDLFVPYEAQGNAGWCWAASTAMLMRYYGKNIHVWDVGKTRPLTWSLTQIKSYIEETYPSEFEIRIGRYSSVSEQVRDDIEGNLSKDYPVLLNVDTSIGRHTIVITGYNSSGFFINDPSGAFFVKGLGRVGSFPYIHEFASWEEFQPLISIDPLDKDTFLVVEGTPSPIDATLFLINDEAGIRTIHESDNGKGVCIDYDDWYWAWGLYWRSIGWHPIAWDSNDNLNYLFEIFNHKSQEASFDFHLEIRGNDNVVYYEKNISDIIIPGYDSRCAVELDIPLNDYLIQGKQYFVSAEIKHHGSSEIIDSITLPPIYYGVKSIMFASECPVRMLVTDPDGLRVGFDPLSNQTVNEIPYALYYYGNESETISIPNQKDGNYSVSVYGVESGTYNLTCTTLDETGFISTESFTNVPIEKDESQTYIIPEYSSFLVLPLFMIATLLAVIVYRRKRIDQSGG